MADSQSSQQPTLQDFIHDACTQTDTRTRWTRMLVGENAAEWLTLERPELLKRLGSLGLPLSERQRLTNAVGRRRRAVEAMFSNRPVYVSSPDVAVPCGGEETRRELRRLILSGEAGYTGGSGEHVRINHGGVWPLHTWVADFAECGDSECGCYRVTWPHVRADFRNMVVLRTATAAQAGGRLAAVRCLCSRSRTSSPRIA